MDQFNQAPAPSQDDFDDLESTVGALSNSMVHMTSAPVTIPFTAQHDGLLLVSWRVENTGRTYVILSFGTGKMAILDYYQLSSAYCTSLVPVIKGETVSLNSSLNVLGSLNMAFTSFNN